MHAPRRALTQSLKGPKAAQHSTAGRGELPPHVAVAEGSAHKSEWE